MLGLPVRTMKTTSLRSGISARVEAVFFDLGGTLADFRDFGQWAADARRIGLDIDEEAIALAWDETKPWLRMSRGSPESTWIDVLARASGSVVSIPQVRQFLEFQAARPLKGELYSDVRLCLDRLTRAQKRLGIVSNSRSEPAVREMLRGWGIESAFEGVVSSGSEGVQKPDPEIFRRGLDRMGVQGSAALFVGDDLVNDYRGASAAGLHAIWLNRLGEGTESDLPEILSLSEVPRIVRLIEAGAPVK